MLQRGFDFAQKTLSAINVLLKYNNYALLTQILCRPYYELAIRLLWASRETDGWECLQAYCANEDKKWAQEALKLTNQNDHAKYILERSERVLALRNADGKSYKTNLKIPEMLRMIKEKDCEQGILQQDSIIDIFEYAYVYRGMCRASHSHLSTIGPIDTSVLVKQTIYFTGLSTFALLRAYCYFAEKDKNKEIETIWKKIAHIFELC